MKVIGIFAGLGLCILFGTVLYFAPKLQEKAEFHKFENDVREFGKVYLKYQRDNGRPPQSLAELQPLVDMAASTTRERVKNDEFTVAWGVPIGPDIPGAQLKVVIIAKPVVQGKQVVIHQDGTVRHYTPEEVAKLVMATVEGDSIGAK